jgi:hypothetical protein
MESDSLSPSASIIISTSMAVMPTEVVEQVRNLGIPWRHYLRIQILMIVTFTASFFFIFGRKLL